MLFKFIFIFPGVFLSLAFGQTAWDDASVKAYLVKNRVDIESFSKQKGIESLPLSLKMAKWASHRAKEATQQIQQESFASLARSILNEATGFGWDNRKPTGLEASVMASTSVDIAMITNDSIDSLFDGSKRNIELSNHYEYLKRAAVAARFVGAKAAVLSPQGIVAWARLSGVAGNLYEPIEFERPENIVKFLKPPVDLVSIVNAADAHDWRETDHPDQWLLPEDVVERLGIAIGVVRAKNPRWLNIYGNATLGGIREVFNELNRLGASVKADLESPSDNRHLSSVGADFTKSPPKFTKLAPLFLLLDPQNYFADLPQNGFCDEGFELAEITISTAKNEWARVVSQATFKNDLNEVSTLLDQMEPIIKVGGFGGQGVHALDHFQIANTQKFLKFGQLYFNDHYVKFSTKTELQSAVQARLESLAENLSVQYDGQKLTKEVIMQHLGYVLNGYPSRFTTSIDSQSADDNVNEQDWLEILSIIFGVSQKLDGLRFAMGIDTTPLNLESNFYSQIFENQHTGGGCVPGRKNRILYRFTTLLRLWMTFGYRLN